jgi:putative methionine-R-sulfoxide reductase with GAF domain
VSGSGEPSGRHGAGTSSDFVTLRDSLAVAERRAATLAELTALMSEGRNPLALAERAVELTARATRAAGAYVYLWDRDEERLVMRVATEGWQRGHLDRVKVRLGEGVTGWSALMRQTVLIPKDPTQDPRFKPFPELRESSFKSMVAVPIVAPGQDVLGVFTLWAHTEDAFSTTDVSLATEVGSLLASGLVQAETLSQLRVQSAAARFLSDLPDDAWGSLDQCLQRMATQCVVHMEAHVCLLEVTADRARPRGGTTVVSVSQEFRDTQGLTIADQDLSRVELTRLLQPLQLQRLRIPLGVGSPIGALTCYRNRRFTEEDELLFEAIGAQVAAGALSLFGIERIRPIVDQLLTSPDAVTTDQLLRRYGWAPRPAWAAVIRVVTTARGSRNPADERVRAALADLFTGDEKNALLLRGGGRYLALSDGTNAAYRERLIDRIIDLSRKLGMRLVAGIGPVASHADEAHRVIRHALVAFQWAELAASADSSVVTYESVAHLRLLPDTALAMSPKVATLLDAFSALVKYDLDSGSDLAQTLDALLANSGSVAKTSAQLFIHRNTLRQRIQRIEELIGQSPENFEDSVIAGVAVRLIRQSEAELGRQAHAPGKAVRCPHGVVTVGRSCCGLPNSCTLQPGRPVPAARTQPAEPPGWRATGTVARPAAAEATGPGST